jgi:hypothetical protein
LKQRCRGLAQADALEPADLDKLQGKTLARDQLHFEAALGANKKGGAPAKAQLVGDGEGWDDVAAGAAAGEEKRGAGGQGPGAGV